MAVDKRKRPARALRKDAHAQVALAASAAVRESKHIKQAARAPGALATPIERVSKSAMRRRKRKAREELGAHGMDGLSDAVADVADELPPIDVSNPDAVPPPLTRTPTGQKAARAALARERARQPQIVAQLARTDNPFAALRTHARHTLGLGDPTNGA
ncbi:hypothetical protein MCUN1_001054 [Malassezia cuniculi]|uniref:Ribosome biogenesis protein SLX9 n=1 Tax=Malassezia cuniculi TaxID=948313 RepID=A0AAF0ETF6_9BASI|nr:hypothetical protein MCUN1_001054 [Malassezia cuniculi]